MDNQCTIQDAWDDKLEGKKEPAICARLPFPPTVNTYWRHVVVGKNARTLISERGRKYKREVAHICARNGIAGMRLAGRLAVGIAIYPPDKRKRDVDNLAKAVLDSLTGAGVWVDDEQIDLLVVERQDIVSGGCAFVTVMMREDVTISAGLGE